MCISWPRANTSHPLIAPIPGAGSLAHGHSWYNHLLNYCSVLHLGLADLEATISPKCSGIGSYECNAVCLLLCKMDWFPFGLWMQFRVLFICKGWVLPGSKWGYLWDLLSPTVYVCLRRFIRMNMLHDPWSHGIFLCDSTCHSSSITLQPQDSDSPALFAFCKILNIWFFFSSRH